MPELPEVETTRRGIEPHLVGQTVCALRVRQRQLRWPIPDALIDELPGRRIQAVERRGKYLLIGVDAATVIAHLGMSGSLRICAPELPPRPHDHVDLDLTGGLCLRFHDPRRFGCLLWETGDPQLHPLLKDLGPEPFADAFSGEYLHALGRRRTASVKNLIMDSHIVVGVGNIYANEALFDAGIHPQRAAGRISLERYRRLAEAIRRILADAIAQGGTTLRDFVNESGRPGYFQQTLRVYGRDGEDCIRCGGTIRSIRLGQRSTFFCADCQR